MRTSKQGQKVLHDREGVRLTAYKDSVGVWTIGYGHTSSAGPPHVTQGMTITKAQAEEIFERDLHTFEVAVTRALKHTPAQHQFDAYVSFAYNVGGGGMTGSTSMKHFNAKQIDQAARTLLNWGKPPEILSRRRGEAVQLRNAEYHARRTVAEWNAALTKPVAVGEIVLPDLPSQPVMPTLRNGSRGAAVEELQRRLFVIDGVFGGITEAAVKAFQKQHTLKADGIVGPITWQALNRIERGA